MNNSPHTLAADPGWKLLGKLNLQTGTNKDDPLQQWLLDILDPLSLSADFLNRVLMSVLDSVARLQQPIGEEKNRTIHVSVSVPYDPSANGKTWGFFYMERTNRHAESAISDSHEFRIYLYPE